MSGYQTKKIDIAPDKTLKKILEGRLFELNENNYSKIISLSEKLNCSAEEAINYALVNVEFIINETPKIKITLDKSRHKIKPAKINPITQY